MSDRTLVVIVRRLEGGAGHCRRCRASVEVDEHTFRAVAVGAAMLCLECSHLLARSGVPFDPADEVLD